MVFVCVNPIQNRIRNGVLIQLFLHSRISQQLVQGGFAGRIDGYFCVFVPDGVGDGSMFQFDIGSIDNVKL